jgi:membrane protease YdiL (CAAX protease family)
MGIVVAAVGLSSAFVGWPTTVTSVGDVAVVPAVLGGIGTGVFRARSPGVVDRSTGAVVAAVASIGLLAYSAYGLGAHLAVGTPRPPLGVGVPLSALAGVGGAVAASADRRAIPPEQIRSGMATAATAAAVGIGGFAVIVVFQYLFVLALAPVGVEPTGTPGTLIGTLALGFGTATTALAYVRATDASLAFLDFGRPSLRDAGYAVAGVVGLFGALIGVRYAFRAVAVESAEHGVVEQAQTNPEILLVLVPASLLIVGPGEELLFRNVVQKSLYESFSRPPAVVIASLVFAVVHFQAYGTGSVLQIASSLAIVFGLSLILGGLYARTDNVVVPAFAHGSFNAIQFAALYLSAKGIEVDLTLVAVLL